MTFQVVHVRRRGGVPAKPVIDLTKKIAPKPINAPPVKAAEKAKPKQPQQPRPVWITAAADGPPIEADLPEKFRKMDAPVHKPLTDTQIEILERIIQKAGHGNPKTLGLRLVLAASQDEHAAAWPIGMLSKAFHASGRRTEGDAVHKVAHGCRVARYGAMAALALAVVNQKKGPEHDVSAQKPEGAVCAQVNQAASSRG